jgi:predicted RNA-binding protein YlxR (DUF448 family)
MEKTKADLLRIVRAPDGAVAINASGKAPGRGAYICASAECVRLAMKRNALAKTLKCPVDKEIYSAIEELCVGRACE